MKEVLISICVPAYKNVNFLKRLMDSIRQQTFRDFEVIITDDSPDDSIKKFIDNYADLPSLRYQRNPVALGTPENWNEGLRLASGKWIKIMHDDDWFADEKSLARLATAIQKTNADFIFSAYNNIYLNRKTTQRVRPSTYRLKAMKKESYTLFAKNIVGPPSVTVHRNNATILYDNKTKWVVDIDFYIRWFKRGAVEYLDECLYNVGMSDEQVTMDCVGNRKVQVPENFYLLNKVGKSKLNNLLVYDGWWRLIRNLEITELRHIREAGYGGDIPLNIVRMMNTQRWLPRKLLTNGFLSKLCMFIHYLFRKSE
jgi:glycosyltransferase involved in cell wall biosynthesis